MSCSTSSSYRVGKQGNNSVELNVTPDRVLLECEWIYDADIPDPEDAYGFMIHVLDDENTVLSVTQNNLLDKESCYDRINFISSILKRGKIIYIGGMGDLKDPRKTEKHEYTFPGIGTFRGNGRVLQFGVIANEKGQCFDAHRAGEKPCPRDPFSIK